MRTPESSDLLLRPAVQDDRRELVALVQVTRRATEDEMPPLRRSEVEIDAFLEGRIALGEVWVAAERQLVGLAVLTRDWLHSLYVGPQHQGAGVGSMLLDLVKAQRPTGFGLWVFASNVSARGFYRRHGLVELEHTDGSAAEEGAPEVRMVWPGTDPLKGLRRGIDEVDDQLAELLARRFALTAAVQGEKRRAGLPAGTVGRDVAREQEILSRMTAHSPGLDVDRVARVMSVVIHESLDQWAAQQAE